MFKQFPHVKGGAVALEYLDNGEVGGIDSLDTLKQIHVVSDDVPDEEAIQVVSRRRYTPNFAYSKEAKLNQLREACRQAITSGVTITTTQGAEHFGLSETDQINIQNLSMQMETTGGGIYHADGKVVRRFNTDEINALSAAATSHITQYTTLYNHLKAWVSRTDDLDEMQKITYEAELPVDLKESMNELLSEE